MSSGNMLKQKKGIQLPHIYVLLFAIIVVCTILTWVLPAGEFDRVVNEATGRTVAVAGTFHTVEQSPVGIFQMFPLILLLLLPLRHLLVHPYHPKHNQKADFL